MKMGLSCACWGDSKLSIGVKYSCVALKGTEIRAAEHGTRAEQGRAEFIYVSVIYEFCWVWFGLGIVAYLLNQTSYRGATSGILKLRL